MGRPLKKDVRGNEVLGTSVSSSGITVQFHDGSTNRTDGIIIIDTNTKTKTSVKLLTHNSYSLTNIEKALNPSINKKSLLEQLCTSILENTKKNCYNLSNIELFYNEGISFS